MRARSSVGRALFASLCVAAAVLAGASCARGSVEVVAGAGGSTTQSRATSGGAGGTGATGGGGAGGGMDAGFDGPVACLHQSDCTALVDACNGGSCVNNVCTKVPKNEGGPCDDGLYCTDGDTCTMGVCAGTPKTCTSTDTCHEATCDEASKSCVQMPGNDGATCAPTDICFLAGACSGGTCVGTVPFDCSFDTDLCNTGSCDPTLGCVKDPLPDGTACSDGLFCTSNDKCTAGVCAGTPMTCPPSAVACKLNTCSEATMGCALSTAPNGTSCASMSTCVSGETCTAGVCGGGQPANQGGACTSPMACVTNAQCNNGTCSGSPLTACVDNDGCCPAGCTPATDNDCNCTLNLALTAVGSTSAGGAPSCCGPSRMNDGVGKSDCNDFSWISNSNLPGNAFWELDWPSPVTIGSFYVEAEASGGTPCSEPPGRNIASANVQVWNGSAWVTVTSFSGKSGDVQLDLPTSMTTTKLRLANVESGPGNGNSIMFEWHVFAGVGCIPPAD